MIDLQKILQDKLNETLETRLVAIAEDKLNKCLEIIISDLMRDWSSFGKDLKEQIEEGLKIKLDRIKLEAYNQRVNNIILAHLENKVDKTITDSIVETINKSLCVLEKDTWNLSEIIKRFVIDERLDKDGNCEITLIIEESNYGSCYIYFDEESGKRTYNCAHRFSIEKSDGKIWHYDNAKRKNKEDVLLSAFEAFCFALYSQRCRIIIDHVQTEYYRDDY